MNAHDRSYVKALLERDEARRMTTSLRDRIIALKAIAPKEHWEAYDKVLALFRDLEG